MSLTSKIKVLVLGGLGYYFRCLLLFQSLLNKKKRVFFFDIDNTLADSWPSFLVPGWTSANSRLSQLAIFINMRKLVLILSRSPFNTVYFISNRSYLSYSTTIQWLKENKIPIPWYRIILTHSPIEKLAHMEASFLRKKGIKVYLIDDLSYNHEAGKVLFYQNVLDRIENINIQYIGAEKISHINKHVS